MRDRPLFFFLDLRLTPSSPLSFRRSPDILLPREEIGSPLQPTPNHRTFFCVLLLFFIPTLFFPCLASPLFTGTTVVVPPPLVSRRKVVERCVFCHERRGM